MVVAHFDPSTMTEKRSKRKHGAGSAVPPTDAPAALERNIAKAKDVAADIQGAADNLAVINTVLQQKIPADAKPGDVAQALRQNEAVEDVVEESANRLRQVNAELDQVAAAKRNHGG